jgi:DNA-binding NarL/FixJ family response regulator
MSNIRILLVDDHALLRETLGERLSREPDFVLAGEAETAEGAVDKSRLLKPDVVLMDIDMPGLICFDAARRIRTMNPACKIIFLSAHVQDQYVEQAVRVGALGYVTKAVSPEMVMAAVRSVAAGRPYFSEDVRSRIVLESDGKITTKQLMTRVSTLTDREIEVIRYIARGLSKKEIARLMSISAKTVDRHSANLMQKLDIHDRVELARFAIREGIVQP